MNKIFFIFDLDGTITQEETLPLIAKHFGVEDKINELTKNTISGNIPFIESFIQRVNILGNFDVNEVNNLLKEVCLFDNIVNFIQENKENCVIATGNCNEWISSLAKKIGCKCYASEVSIKDNKIDKLTHVIKKEDIVSKYKSLGYQVVVIGDGNNDMEAMRKADVSIACGLIHFPANSVMSVADYVVFSEKSLLRLLNQIKEPQKGISLILSCAGIGSRLGLDKTKALIEIENKKLIHWQLEHLNMIEDIRIVIGYQSYSVINAVLEQTKEIIFVYNHDYFYTKTGASFYLGTKHANEYCIEWDGDLLVHPDDVLKCIEYDGEYIAGSDILSEDSVCMKINENNQVISFSKEYGDFEWTGPAKIKRDKIKYTSTNVFNQLEEYLPLPFLKINARDIDTYADYKNAIEFVRSWNE